MRYYTIASLHSSKCGFHSSNYMAEINVKKLACCWLSENSKSVYTRHTEQTGNSKGVHPTNGKTGTGSFCIKLVFSAKKEKAAPARGAVFSFLAETTKAPSTRGFGHITWPPAVKYHFCESKNITRQSRISLKALRPPLPRSYNHINIFCRYMQTHPPEPVMINFI